MTIAEASAHRSSAFWRPSDGCLVPWRVRVGDSLPDQPINRAFCANDQAFELRAVLAGEVIGRLAAPTAVPLTRAVQQARVRRLIDLTVDHLTADAESVFSDEELRLAQAREWQQ